jgi:hypothetical protein
LLHRQIRCQGEAPAGRLTGWLLAAVCE